MATNDIWRLLVKGSVNGQNHQHSLHFRANDPLMAGPELTTAWMGAPATAYRNCFHVNAACMSLIVAAKVCGSVPLPIPTETTPAGTAANGTRVTSADDPAPTFIASLVTEKGSLAGRSRSGRFFLGGLFESDLASDYLSAAYIARVQGYVNALLAAFVTPTSPAFRLFAFSRLLAEGDVNHDPPIYPAAQCQDAGSDVSQLIVSNRVTTMRSRKLGNGG